MNSQPLGPCTAWCVVTDTWMWIATTRATRKDSVAAYLEMSYADKAIPQIQRKRWRRDRRNYGVRCVKVSLVEERP